MKFRLFCITVSILMTCGGTWSQVSTGTGVATSTRNPMQIAMLHWYDVNLAATFPIPPGTSDSGLVFDGENIWVSDYFDNSLVKVRANDGKVLGVFGVSAPSGLTFDGAHIWVANLLIGEGNVTKIRASDGAVVGHYDLKGGIDPSDITFDGANVWVADLTSNTVSKVRARDGAVLGNFPAGPQPNAISFDGSNIWVANHASPCTVTKLRASDGQILGTFTVGQWANGLAFDGQNMWVIGDVLTKFRASDGQKLATTPVSGGRLAFDGANIWVANSPIAFDTAFMWMEANGSTVTKVRASDGKVLGSFPVPAVNNSLAKL